MKTLKDIFINEIGLNEEHLIQFGKILKIIHLQKKEFLIEAGDICSFMGFVQEGVLRTYVYKEGEEYNIDFHLPNSFVSGYKSFLTQTPTKAYIQALSDTTIFFISYSDYHNLLKNSTDWYRLGKYIADTLFNIKCERESALLMDSAIERYKSLLIAYPRIEQLVAQYHIASYLGIKPESLSRIKPLTYINK
jgi:CRP-like cAMP-binding protein